MTRRVAVTGIGVICALGRHRSEFWASLAQGRSAIGPMTLIPQGALRFENAAEVPDYRAADYLEEKEAAMIDRFAQFALIAAREAVGDAGIGCAFRWLFSGTRTSLSNHRPRSPRGLNRSRGRGSSDWGGGEG